MTILSKLFGRSKTEPDRIFAEAKKHVEQEYGPMGKVGIAVMRAATNSRDAIKGQLLVPTESKRSEIEVHAFWEFVYFYMHMTMRAAAAQLTNERIEKLQGYLGPLVSSVAIDSYCAHWPDDLKRRMTAEFFENLNNAELEYSHRAKAASTSPGEEGARERMRALFMSLALNISKLVCDGHADIVVITAIFDNALKEWAAMDLGTLIAEIKNSH